LGSQSTETQNSFGRPLFQIDDVMPSVANLDPSDAASAEPGIWAIFVRVTFFGCSLLSMLILTFILSMLNAPLAFRYACMGIVLFTYFCIFRACWAGCTGYNSASAADERGIQELHDLNLHEVSVEGQLGQMPGTKTSAVITERPQDLAIHITEKCVVCWEEDSELAFVPCGHQCVCARPMCSSLPRCPLCRQQASSLCVGICPLLPPDNPRLAGSTIPTTCSDNDNPECLSREEADREIDDGPTDASGSATKSCDDTAHETQACEADGVSLYVAGGSRRPSRSASREHGPSSAGQVDVSNTV